MRLYKKLKKPWASTKKELKRQFPNLKFSRQHTILSLLVLFGYLIHLNNFLTIEPRAQFVPISSAFEEITPSPTPQVLGLVTPIPTPNQIVIPDNSRKVVVPVLMYHYIQNAEGRDGLTQDLSVKPELLDSQLSYLVSQGFTTISPEELYQSLVVGSPLPNKPILLTFDDGYGDFYHQAYPILKKYQVKATNFVPIGLVDRPYYLTTPQVKELASDPLITIASHTLHHPDLTVSSPESAWDEISNGKKKLEEVLGKEVAFFAYPFGALNSDVVDMVGKSGFKIAFSTRYGVEHSVGSRLVLPRVRIGGTQSLENFKEKFP